MTGTDRSENAAALLAGLEAAHRQIETALDRADAWSDATSCDPGELAELRPRVSQANIARRRTVRAIRGQMTGVMSADSVEAFRALQRRDLDQLMNESELMRAWTPQLIEAEWETYRAVAAQSNDELRQLLLLEKLILFPILTQEDGRTWGT